MANSMAATPVAAVQSAKEGQVIGCHTVQSWTEQFDKGKESKKLVVVDFTASWCGPCRFISPIRAELAKKMPHVIFLKVDIDELQSVAQEWNIEAMPTFIFLKEGKHGCKERGSSVHHSKACYLNGYAMR